MSGIPVMLFAFAALFLPIAAYCLVLAMINRRINPLMVSGEWDAVGLLLACSGGLLVCGPGIIYVNTNRNALYRQIEQDVQQAKKEIQHQNEQPEGQPEQDRPHPPEASSVGLWRWLIWGGYYIVVLSGAALLVVLRRGKTVIYNCDPDLFDLLLPRILDRCSLAHVRVGRKVFIGPREVEAAPPSQNVTTVPGSGTAALPTALAAGGRLGQVNVASFPAMCHVTLHWHSLAPGVRQEIEDKLRRNLDECRSLENPAAGWFLSVSSILFFFSLAVVVFFLLIVFVPHR